jgi:hypothetical protein
MGPIFLILKQRDETKPFHVCTGGIQSLLDGPKGNPKNIPCDCSIRNGILSSEVCAKVFQGYPGQDL